MLGMHVHRYWSYKPPYATKTWSEADTMEALPVYETPSGTSSEQDGAVEGEGSPPIVASRFWYVPTVFAFALLTVLSSSAMGQAAFDLVFSEPPDRSAETVRWPVTVGVPFADGAVAKDAPLALTGSDGQPVSLQSQVLVDWRTGKKTPQWVLLDFQTEVARGPSPRFTVRPGALSATKPQAIRIEDAEETIRIDTGAISFSVSKRRFSLFDKLDLAGGVPGLERCSVYWCDQDGRLYETRRYGESEVVIERAGPLRAVIRAEGWYAPVGGEAGPPQMRYQVRIAAFAGLPYVRIHHTLIWTADDSVSMKDFGLCFTRATKAERVRVGRTGSQSLDLRPGTIKAVQEKHEQGRLIIAGRAAEERQFSGWVETTGPGPRIGVSIRDMAMQLPKAFTATADDITAHLWAPQAGPMSMKLEDRAHPSYARTDYNKEWKDFNKTVSPQGAAKTHEVWIWAVDAQAPSPEAVNDLVQRPVVAMADPVYQCSTEAIPGIRPSAKTPAKYGFIEDGLAAMARYIAAPDERFQDYDLWSFGDVHLFSTYWWRTWDCGGYNWPQVPWFMFYRTGERDFYVHGEQNARHVMDVDICHHGTLGAPAYQKGLGQQYMYSTWHWAWGPIWDNFHTHPHYLFYYYCMTGYERAAEVLRLMAKGSGALTAFEKPDRAIFSRTQYGQIDPKIAYYRLTGDAGFLASAQAWARNALVVRDPDGRFPNNIFWNFFHGGLIGVYQLAGDKAVRDALLAQAEPFKTPPHDALTAPAWDRNSFVALPFAYEVTGNAAYLNYPMWRIMEQTRMTMPKGPITPFAGGPGHVSMARTMYPTFIDSALHTLGAWHDAGFPEVRQWPANNPQFGSFPTQEGNFKSALTFFVKKAPGQAGEVRLLFKASNLNTMELLAKDQRMEARITPPASKPWVAPLTLTPDPILLPAERPAGEYRFDILGEQPLFWLCPKTDLPGLVVHCPQSKVRFAFREDPGRIYFRLQPDAAKLRLQAFGARRHVIVPVRIVGPGDRQIAYYPREGGEEVPPLVVDVPQDARQKVLALAKGYFNEGLWYADVDGIQIQDAHPYFAVQPDQWFLPSVGPR